ncbi:MAG: tRNA cyclic N6-threonylcarbamoyladenosine(37) synthase TcdA [Halobacteriovoraceae bacterium]|nr:tRNA cyclic N6-threonylcarbamoyladenosine(37) synthase TcdA [Halobacteriovoraceae bacterium]|tara:strand:- start:116668 stop:117438 length:771 start_codon:yes stop_codon:yes gene_type:complete
METKSPFEGVERLYTQNGFNDLAKAHVMVVGIGGVGSWAAEALARSGVGKLTLVDLDDICVTNINRQIHATSMSVGKMKVQQMKHRIVEINPNVTVEAIEDFFSQSSMEDILSIDCDYIIDAIDSVKSKCLLIAECNKRSIPLVVTGGAGGKINPSLIQESDLNRSYNCRLLAQVRKRLKVEHGFSRNKKRKYKIPCIFSPEDQILPEKTCSTDKGPTNINCENGFGSSVFITGTFGFMAAARVINDLAMGAKNDD